MKQEIKQSRIAVTRQVVVCTLHFSSIAMPDWYLSSHSGLLLSVA